MHLDPRNVGFNIRKYKGKLLIKPAMKGIKTFLENIREKIKLMSTVKTSADSDQADTSPYDPAFQEYFAQRKGRMYR